MHVGGRRYRETLRPSWRSPARNDAAQALQVAERTVGKGDRHDTPAGGIVVGIGRPSDAGGVRMGVTIPAIGRPLALASF